MLELLARQLFLGSASSIVAKAHWPRRLTNRA